MARVRALEGGEKREGEAKSALKTAVKQVENS
jgi:ribosomal protein S20